MMSLSLINEESDTMNYEVGDYVATHSEPVWRTRSNFVFRVPIESDERQRRWEQLWWNRTDNGRFILCCIPFFAYDLSLGDEVEVDRQRENICIIKRSDQCTYRVWLGEGDSVSRNVALALIVECRPLMEWSSYNLLALSVPMNDEQPLADMLQRLENKGFLTYETGRSRLPQ